jgi:hypothetical protein
LWGVIVGGNEQVDLRTAGELAQPVDVEALGTRENQAFEDWRKTKRKVAIKALQKLKNLRLPPL